MNVTRAYVNALAETLSERDLGIIELVGRFKVVTGAQIERMLFAHCSERSRARARQAVLRRLVEHRVLAAVGRRRVGGSHGGSSGIVYALDVAGQQLAKQTSSRSRRPYTHYEPTMQHYLLTAELFVRLIEAERAGQLALIKFEGEPWCWRSWTQQTLKPDAFVEVGVVAGSRGWKRSWFIEVDRAAEWGTKISSKLPQYLHYRDYTQPSGRVFPQVLFLAPSERRVDYLQRLVEQRGDSALFHVGLFENAIHLLKAGISGI